MNKTLIFLSIVLAVNLIVFLLYIIDKRKAIKGSWRIPEKVLLWWALPAPWGAFAGMRLVRHKTQHKKFTILVSLFMTLHVVLTAGYVYHFIIAV
mgnify:CR=1 FL=1